ncbi:hypothetical protein CHELA20_40416 [Hyphomicrobiales bacterium]|nr:hypothetical protein CHELA20_40416 [Hyphomicrobiales bacterium]CAH1688600.1 hypothetical protein CHELA41_40273 [Hyphomicrobiales bacterium]
MKLRTLTKLRAKDPVYAVKLTRSWLSWLQEKTNGRIYTYYFITISQCHSLSSHLTENDRRTVSPMALVVYSALLRKFYKFYMELNRRLYRNPSHKPHNHVVAFIAGDDPIFSTSSPVNGVHLHGILAVENSRVAAFENMIVKKYLHRDVARIFLKGNLKIDICDVDSVRNRILQYCLKTYLNTGESSIISFYWQRKLPSR